MYYPQELIEEIRMQNDIVSVISEYVPLKQKGSSYFGLCPFHNESTPSFSVSADKQFYYCFGCGAAGNVYSFLMQMENCDFVEAVQKLADRVHITLPEPAYEKEAKEREQLKQRLYAIHKATGLFYYERLLSGEGQAALAYLNNRKIHPKIQRKFGLGYSPDKVGALREHLEGLGFSMPDMLKSGLVMENKNGKGYHDRFYNRLMFPIFDAQGRGIGFGGRILEKGEPKYLNSPETLIFNKSKNLYGLNFAKMAKNKELILVEGYMDMISIYQAGFHNVVASLGTAFNHDHAKALKRYTSDVLLLFDSDDAGTNAILRAIPVLVKNGFHVRVAQVTGGKDPDEFIKQYGVEEFGKLLVEAKSYISFQLKTAQKKYHMDRLEDRIQYTEEAAKILSELPSEIEREAYRTEIAKVTGISDQAIHEEITKLKKQADSAFVKEAAQKKKRVYAEQAAKASKSKGILEAQRELLYLCASNNSLCTEVSKWLQSEEFPDAVYSRLAAFIYEAQKAGKTLFPGEVVSFFETVEEQNLVARVFAQKPAYNTNIDIEKAVNEEVRLIKKAGIDVLAAQAATIDEVKNLIEKKRKLDEMYINVSKG